MKYNLNKEVVEAFLQQKSKKHGNVESTGLEFYLFGNCIAKHKKMGLYISDGNYEHTASTQRYLNEIGATITLKKNQFYKDGVLWDGKEIKLSEVPVEIKEKQSLFD